MQRKQCLELHELRGSVSGARERRRYPRVQADVVFRPAGADLFHHNRITRDVSLGGIRVYSQASLPKEVAQYRPADFVRLQVKPGPTCFWQISGRSTVSFDQWMEYDRQYVRSMSLWLT